jgi:hypothetical protein
MWYFQHRCSSRITPRKLKLLTCSMVISSNFISGGVIFLFMGLYTMNVVLEIFRESLCKDHEDSRNITLNNQRGKNSKGIHKKALCNHSKSRFKQIAL